MSNMARTPFGLMSQTSELFRMLSDNKCHAIFNTVAISMKRRVDEVEEGKGIDSMNTVSLTKLGQKAYQESLLSLIKTDLIAE